MPKLSRRRRQLKEIITNRKGEADSCDDELDEGEESEEREQETTRPSNRASRSSTIQLASSPQEPDVNEDDRPWVQCNKCDKWRALPNTVDVSRLPDVWYCNLNIWDTERMSCDVPEETYRDPEEQQPVRAFCKLWTKRLKNADRAETKLPPSAVTRGRKRKQEVDWIRCSNAACGKWRAISIRGVDMTALVKRLNTKGKWGGKAMTWYCSMNTWDETKASCAAPQEPLFDTAWSLGITDA